MKSWILVCALFWWLPPAVLAGCGDPQRYPPTTPDDAFVLLDDGTVIHKPTGLMWMRCPLGQTGDDCGELGERLFDWGEALAEADQSTFAGHDDWRLPNVKELLSIVELGCTNPTINERLFPNTASRQFWTASPQKGDGDNAWAVSFGVGKVVAVKRTSTQLQVRLVRSLP